MAASRGKVLITGGGGYIGSVAVNHFLDANWNVSILDTFYWGTDIFKDKKVKVKIIQKDIRDISSKDLSKFSVIVHAAGLSNDPMANFNPQANFQINTLATDRLATLAKKSGVQKFIFASSASIYDLDGLSGAIIQDEKSKVSPKAAYSLSKYKAERTLIRLKDKNFAPIILRQGTVFGFSPRMRFDLVVNTMLKDALTKKELTVLCRGNQWRPLVDVNDVAEAYVLMCSLDPKYTSGEIFNLVYKNYKMLDLAQIVKKTLKKEIGLDVNIIVDKKENKGRTYQISGEKIREILDWQPKISPEDSIKHMLGPVQKIPNLDHPRFYNIEWMMTMLEVERVIKKVKRIFR